MGPAPKARAPRRCACNDKRPGEPGVRLIAVVLALAENSRSGLTPAHSRLIWGLVAPSNNEGVRALDEAWWARSTECSQNEVTFHPPKRSSPFRRKATSITQSEGS